MESAVTVETPRLLLRPWRDADLSPFWAMCSDARVMEFLPAVPDRAASDARVARYREHFERHGFGPWAVEVRGGDAFVGFVGLHVNGEEAGLPFGPGVDIGWRLAHAAWGKGYATEAARAVLDFGFGRLGLAEVLSFTVPANARSQRVMERIGMARSHAEDFDHPSLPEGHPLRRHVLYRAMRPG